MQGPTAEEYARKVIDELLRLQIPRRDFLHSFAVLTKSEALLTPTEREIVVALCTGMGVREVARKMGIEMKTVQVHRQNAYRKLDLHSQVEMVRWAFENKLVGVVNA